MMKGEFKYPRSNISSNEQREMKKSVQVRWSGWRRVRGDGLDKNRGIEDLSDKGC